MSINSAYNIANTGLKSTGKWAELVSNNIANADSDSYGRRTLSKTTTAMGTAVANGVNRAVDQSLTRMYHSELARMTRQDAIADGVSAYATSLGDVDDASSPAALLTNFQSDLDLLYNDPSDASVQQAAVQSAGAIATGLNTLSRDLDTSLKEVRNSLLASVDEVNKLLSDVALLNQRLENTLPNSQQRAALEDQMGDKLNQLAEFIDFRTETNGNGSVDVMTTDGYRLVEDDASFDLNYNVGSGVLTAGTVDITPPNGIAEGRLAGQIELVNDIMPQMQLQLDEFARALIQTFEAADASLAAGDTGLFTDEGLAYDPARITGLASRIEINDAVLPEQGGEISRIRDGMNAVTPGPSGSAIQIGAFLDGLDAAQTFDGATSLPTNVSLSDYASALIADQQNTRATAEKEQEGLAASASSLNSARLNAQGVNIDTELQDLLMIEQAYAANSKVISTLNEMIDSLLAAV